MLRLTVAILIIISAGTFVGADARMYIVDQDGFSQYKSIGGVVAVAKDGDTIYIKPGVYKEHIVLDKRLTLMPLRGEEGIINLAGDGNDIGIEVLADGCKIEGITISDFSGPGIFVGSNGNEIRNNVLENNVHGIFVRESSGNVLENNRQIGGYGGIVLISSFENTITRNVAEGSILAGVLLNSSSKNAISGSTAQGCGRGIYLITGSRDNVFEGNSMIDCGYGVLLETGGEANVFRSSSIDNATTAAALNFASKNLFEKNSITNSTNGFALFSSSGNRIIENDLSGMETGIMVSGGSVDNLFDKNMIEESSNGIVITESSGNDLAGNVMAGVRWGLYVDGSTEESFDNDIPESNQIDGRPILYLYRRSGEVVSGREFSHITLAFCEDSIVKENSVTNDALFVRGSQGCRIEENAVSGGFGMRFEGSPNNEILRNRVYDNRYSGILLLESDGNLIEANNLYRNQRDGISILGSDSNRVRGNSAEENGAAGIRLRSSNDTEITANTMTRNGVGIALMESSGCIVYRNNLIENEVQAEDDGENLWDWGVLKGGNYWSDHSCTGKPCQSSPRRIGEATADYYPFGERDGWV